MRDIVLTDTVFMAFTTRAFATGIPTVLAGTPVVSAYEDAGLTQITAGITLGVDHDSVVGLNMLTIVATGANGYEADKDYNLVITTGTVGGVSVVGEIVGQFSIQRAPVNWANVTDPTTAVDLSGTDIQLVATTTTNTDMRGTDSAATATALATVDTNVDSILVDTTAGGAGPWTTGAGTGLTPLASGTAQGGTSTTIQLAAAETFADGELEGNVVKITAGTGKGQSRVIISNIGSTDTATIAPNWTTNPASDSVYEIVDGSINLSVFNLGEVTTSLETSADVADAVHDEQLSDHTTAGSAGKAVSDIEIDTGTDIPALITALNDISVSDILTTQMIEAFAADGVAPTLAQALFLIQQQLGDFSISGTTLTVRKIDGTTTAATFTLDSATAPTDITRAT